MRQSPGFQFKQFYVRHDRCAMKVGTDGVLLGAWTAGHVVSDRVPRSILDVGTGSGLIALMLAQRCTEAHIDAIDIDAEAAGQAKENFEQSAFSPRLTAYPSGLQDWPSSFVHRTSYDLIVSNPPYFSNSLKNPDLQRMTARHTDSLSYEELVAHSVRLLKAEGILALIVPADQEQHLIDLAQQHRMYCARATRVYSKENKPARRVLLAFQKGVGIPAQASTLILEDETGGRSAAYSQLCQEFYL